jgi:hypothetical protein
MSTENPNPDDGDAFPELDRERGTYIGPCTQDEALEAIRGHSSGPVIIEYPAGGFTGGERKLAQGFQSEVKYHHADEEDPEGEPTGVFVLSEAKEGSGPIPLSWGVLYEGSTVLDLSHDSWAAEAFTGGLDIYREGRREPLVRIVFWQAIQHVTETGDVAPGFGPIDAGIEGAEDEEGDE